MNFPHDMRQSHEVLAMMGDHTTGIDRKRGFSISRCGAFLLTLLFVLGIVVTDLSVHHFASCLDGRSAESSGDSSSTDISNSMRPFSKHETMQKKIAARLPKSIVPESYEIKLMPFIWESNFTFNGEVSIRVKVVEDTKNITLHAMDMEIDHEMTTIKEENSLKNIINILDQTNDTVRQFHIIQTEETLQAGKYYIINMKFVGYLNDNLQGFYRSSYTVGNKKRWIAATNFHATQARRVFPCFDEPELKAKFQISIARPSNMTSISNMPKRGDSEQVLEMPSYVWDHYEQSVRMSTYLVAFLVSDFDFRKSPNNNFKVWARKEAIEQANYALKIGPEILKYYEDYFDIKFPLEKIDLVALPDFSYGAMENWGLITYRETAMLFEKGVSTSSSQQRVAITVAHELAHQWFGNLVTPSWWSDVWLNEGFATYVGYIGADSAEPKWNVLEQFVTKELQDVFTLDALASSHPISIEVGHPDEIQEIFDRISYGKGASIIRMMDHFLTTKVFKQGLTNYLNSKAYQSAEQNDLWNALTEQAHKDNMLPRNVTIKQIMDNWTLQTGFPVITVTRDYDNDEANLTQERFMIQNKSSVDKKSESLWWVPITYTTQGLRDFEKTQPSHWMKAEPFLKLTNIGAASDQWIIFNIQETGFYRVNYDKKNWQMIIDQLKSDKYKVISTINRGQLIDDALNLARAGKLDYFTALDVTSYLPNETEYVPWKSALTAFGYLDDMLNKFQGYDKFRIYILKLLDNIYKKVGFEDSDEDLQHTVFTRIEILTWACKFGLDHCVKNAVSQFENWRNQLDPDAVNPISPNLKTIVYNTAIETGGQKEWDFAWERYLQTNVGSEKELLLNALGCTREPWILSRYLEWAITENSGIRKQDAKFVFEAVSENVIGKPLVFSFLRNNWSRLEKYFGSTSPVLNKMVTAATKKISTRCDLQDLLEFEREHGHELGSATRSVQQSIEQAEANIRWLDNNYITIRDWLLKNTA